MPTFTQQILLDVERVGKAIGYGPDIAPNFAHAGIATTLAVMRCLLDGGVNHARSIHDYLAARGSRYDFETIEALLEAFDGDDPRYHLWSLLRDDDDFFLAS